MLYFLIFGNAPKLLKFLAPFCGQLNAFLIHSPHPFWEIAIKNPTFLFRQPFSYRDSSPAPLFSFLCRLLINAPSTGGAVMAGYNSIYPFDESGENMAIFHIFFYLMDIPFYGITKPWATLNYTQIDVTIHVRFRERQGLIIYDMLSLDTFFYLRVLWIPVAGG